MADTMSPDLPTEEELLRYLSQLRERRQVRIDELVDGLADDPYLVSDCLLEIGPAIVPALAAVLEHPKNETALAHAVWVLGELRCPEAAALVPEILRLLEAHPHDEVGEAAAEAVQRLMHLSPPPADLIVRLLFEPGRGGRDWLADALGWVGAGSSRALSALTTLLSDDDGLVRLHAASSLAEIGQRDPAALRALEDARDSEDPAVARVVEECLAWLRRQAEEAVPPEGDRRPVWVREGVSACEELLTRGEVEAGLAGLLACLHADDWSTPEHLAQVRIAACEILGRAGSVAAPLVGELCRTCTDSTETPLVRAASARALAQCAGPAPDVLRALACLWRDTAAPAPQRPEIDRARESAAGAILGLAYRRDPWTNAEFS